MAVLHAGKQGRHLHEWSHGAAKEDVCANERTHGHEPFLDAVHAPDDQYDRDELCYEKRSVDCQVVELA